MRKFLRNFAIALVVFPLAIGLAACAPLSANTEEEEVYFEAWDFWDDQNTTAVINLNTEGVVSGSHKLDVSVKIFETNYHGEPRGLWELKEFKIQLTGPEGTKVYATLDANGAVLNTDTHVVTTAFYWDATEHVDGWNQSVGLEQLLTQDIDPTELEVWITTTTKWNWRHHCYVPLVNCADWGDMASGYESADIFGESAGAQIREISYGEYGIVVDADVERTDIKKFTAALIGTNKKGEEVILNVLTWKSGALTGSFQHNAVRSEQWEQDSGIGEASSIVGTKVRLVIVTDGNEREVCEFDITTELCDGDVIAAWSLIGAPVPTTAGIVSDVTASIKSSTLYIDITFADVDFAQIATLYIELVGQEGGAISTLNADVQSVILELGAIRLANENAAAGAPYVLNYCVAAPNGVQGVRLVLITEQGARVIVSASVN